MLVLALSAPASAGASGGGRASSDRDCSDFSNQKAAQEYFVSKGGPRRDPDRLDGDHDGKACDSLPCPCSSVRGKKQHGGGGSVGPRHGPRYFHGRCRRGRHPDRRCTPGRTFRGVSAGDVCTPGWSRRHRNVSQRKKQRVYLAYGIRRHRPGAFEVDHLIPLELGGNNSRKNLWPERQPGAGDLDVLENSLHDRVCAATLSLHTAQRRIVRAKYRR